MTSAAQQARAQGHEVMYRESRPYLAFALMTAPFVPLLAVILIPLVWPALLLVFLPIEFGRIGGRRLSRADALWVSIPAALTVATMELWLILTILSVIPGNVVAFDPLGVLATAVIYGANLFFFSVGALSTAWKPEEAVVGPPPAEPLP